MNSTFNTTACVVQIIGWCSFSEDAQAGIIMGFISIGIVFCCCYCAAIQENKLDIQK